MNSFITRLLFFIKADRIGPDIPISHWKLHFKKSMRNQCLKKFKHFGENAEFRPGAYAINCSRISIGRNVVIRPGSMLFGDLKADLIIEDDVMLGSGVHIYLSNHRFDDPTIPIIQQGSYPAQNVVLRRGCWIGASAIILPGVEIGENAVVGAGSIVTKSVPPRVVAVGNPAKIIKSIERKDGENVEK